MRSILAALSFPTLLLLRPSHGFPSFIARIPNGGNVRGCDGELVVAIGHINGQTGGGPRNAFGLDFQRLGNTWNKELCETDSDGDGRTNGEELGDPDCTWDGKSPLPETDTPITHPGERCEDSGTSDSVSSSDNTTAVDDGRSVPTSSNNTNNTSEFDLASTSLSASSPSSLSEELNPSLTELEGVHSGNGTVNNGVTGSNQTWESYR